MNWLISCHLQKHRLEGNSSISSSADLESDNQAVKRTESIIASGALENMGYSGIKNGNWLNVFKKT